VKAFNKVAGGFMLGTALLTQGILIKDDSARSKDLFASGDAFSDENLQKAIEFMTKVKGAYDNNKIHSLTGFDNNSEQGLKEQAVMKYAAELVGVKLANLPPALASIEAKHGAEYKGRMDAIKNGTAPGTTSPSRAPVEPPPGDFEVIYEETANPSVGTAPVTTSPSSGFPPGFNADPENAVAKLLLRNNVAKIEDLTGAQIRQELINGKEALPAMKLAGLTIYDYDAVDAEINQLLAKDDEALKAALPSENLKEMILKTDQTYNAALQIQQSNAAQTPVAALATPATQMVDTLQAYKTLARTISERVTAIHENFTGSDPVISAFQEYLQTAELTGDLDGLERELNKFRAEYYSSVDGQKFALTTPGGAPENIRDALGKLGTEIIKYHIEGKIPPQDIKSTMRKVYEEEMALARYAQENNLPGTHHMTPDQVRDVGVQYQQHRLLSNQIDQAEFDKRIAEIKAIPDIQTVGGAADAWIVALDKDYQAYEKQRDPAPYLTPAVEAFESNTLTSNNPKTPAPIPGG
jgi:hypothetical protein